MHNSIIEIMLVGEMHVEGIIVTDPVRDSGVNISDTAYTAIGNLPRSDQYPAFIAVSVLGFAYHLSGGSGITGTIAATVLAGSVLVFAGFTYYIRYRNSEKKMGSNKQTTLLESTQNQVESPMRNSTVSQTSTQNTSQPSTSEPEILSPIVREPEDSHESAGPSHTTGDTN